MYSTSLQRQVVLSVQYVFLLGSPWTPRQILSPSGAFSAESPSNKQITMAKPTIVLVPGAWHKGSIYSPTASLLESHGYPTICLDLPSAGAVPPNTSFDGDVSAIRDCLTSLISQDKEVVLVSHSYGGFPAGEAPKGLSKKERSAQGLKGGVIRFVVINGVAMPAPYQPHPTGDYSAMPEWIDKDIPVLSPFHSSPLLSLPL
jgi:pimeloyl-ACP methyl ester carboxylesterase